MSTEIRTDKYPPDAHSDAAPVPARDMRRPGELGFAAFLTVASLILLYNAYDISGFDALSAPGSVPMATTFVMVIAAFLIAVHTAKRPMTRTESLSKDIVPLMVIIFAFLLLCFGLLLKPLGFLPTAALFLIVSFKILARRGWVYTMTVALGSLVVIWLIFRVVFTVLLPAGIVPEAEFIQIFRNMLSGGLP